MTVVMRWCFNDDANTCELVCSADTYKAKYFADMDTTLLNDLMARLVTSGRWSDHVAAIRKELKSRTPPKLITSVTIEDKL